MVSAAPPTAAGIAARYRKINGLHGAEVTDGDRILLRVGAVTGLRIARPLADHIRAALAKQRQPTPTIEYTRGANVMFLVNPPADETYWDALFKYAAVRMSRGAAIALPGPGGLAWLERRKATDGSFSTPSPTSRSRRPQRSYGGDRTLVEPPSHGEPGAYCR